MAPESAALGCLRRVDHFQCLGVRLVEDGGRSAGDALAPELHLLDQAHVVGIDGAGVVDLGVKLSTHLPPETELGAARRQRLHASDRDRSRFRNRVRDVPRDRHARPVPLDDVEVSVESPGGRTGVAAPALALRRRELTGTEHERDGDESRQCPRSCSSWLPSLSAQGRRLSACSRARRSGADTPESSTSLNGGPRRGRDSRPADVSATRAAYEPNRQRCPEGTEWSRAMPLSRCSMGRQHRVVEPTLGMKRRGRGPRPPTSRDGHPGHGATATGS